MNVVVPHGAAAEQLTNHSQEMTEEGGEFNPSITRNQTRELWTQPQTEGRAHSSESWSVVHEAKEARLPECQFTKIFCVGWPKECENQRRLS